MASYNIKIESGQFVITDNPQTLEIIRSFRGDTVFSFDDTNDTFQYFYNVPVVNGTAQRTLLGSNINSFTFADLNTVTEEGVPVVVATASDLATYLGSKLSFFFNPDPVDVVIVGGGVAENVISTANSTTALLGIGATFSGAWENVVPYTTVATAILGSLATDGTLFFDLSTDGGVTFTSVPSTISDTTFAVPRILNVVETHVRIRYVNGLTAQTGTFSIQTKYSNNQELALLSSIDGFINGETPTQVVKSVITSRQPDGTFRNNPHNGVALSTEANLGIGATFVSDWIDTDGYNVIETFINSDVISAVGGVLFDFTDDLSGVPDVKFTETSSFTAQEIIDGGTNLFIAPKMVGFRLTYTNGAIAQTSFLLQTDLKTNGRLASRLDATLLGNEDVELRRSVIAGRVLDDLLEETDSFANVSLLSNKALKTAIPPTAIYQISRPTDPAIPTGATITIDPVLNTEPNVSDSGWIPVKSFGGGLLINIISNASLQIYLMNSSDEIGSNVIGDTAPIIITNAGFGSTFGSPFFDDYFRVVAVNASGGSATEYSMKAVGQQTAAPPVFTALDQAIGGFFPAPITRSVLAGADTDGNYHNVITTRNGNLAQTITDADLGFHQIVTPGGASKVASQTHLVGEPFGGASLNVIEWSIDLVGSGTQDATGAGELSMDTGITLNSAVEIESTDLARFIPANYNTSHHAVTIPDGAGYASDNSRKWGAFEATNAAGGNGVYFEIDDGDWFVAHCLNGTPTRIAQVDWNGLGAGSFPTNSISANVYEIEYNAGSIIFRVNANVIHRETLLAMPYAEDIHFPVGMNNTNYNGSTTDVSLKLRAASIYTLGKGLGQERPFYISGTTAGVIIKTGAGHLGRVILSRTGSGGGDASISIYDALSATNQVGRLAIGGDGVEPVEYDFTFNIGLFVVITGSGTLGTTITFD